MVKFNASKYELHVILEICQRAGKHFTPEEYDRTTMIMDIEACHSNGCELDLGRLLSAPDYDFIHDIAGIRRHIDRTTGQLTDCFVPRTALQQVTHAKE